MSCKRIRSDAHSAEFLMKASGTPAGRDLRLRISSLACGAVRITRTTRETFLDRDSDIVVRREPGTCTVTETDREYRMDCGAAAVCLNRRTGSLSFFDSEGRTLLREREEHPCELKEKPVLLNRFAEDAEIRFSQSADGVRASAENYETIEDRKAYEWKLAFRFAPDEGLYGLGSHEEGTGNLRGKTRELYQHNLKAVIPLLVSTKGWGILPDIGCYAVFRDEPEESALRADCADEMDIYFLSGGYESVCGMYRELTGRAPMLPRYAFGYVQSKERYKDAAEILAVVREYRRRQVPLDVIVEDWQSWPEGQWGWKVFDRERFPDPRGWTDELHALGAKLMISVWPSMQGEANENRKEMLENGCMLGNRVIYNAFDPKARKLYWKQAEEGLFRYGVDAWWCDCSEPFESDWKGSVKPDPSERARINTEEAKTYLDPGKISLYSLYHSKGIYEGQRGSGSGKRVLNLTRSSWAGQHRYATVTWSGDVSATWETLRRQVPEGLNFMAACEAYWTTDAGGFFPGNDRNAWFIDGDFSDGVSDPGYRELYVRWLQFAAFLPMMRSHGTGTPREIWQFGEKGGKWYDAIEKIIRFRSRLVPTLYSLAAGYSRTGVPPVRVPALMFPEDAALRRTDREMMLGDALLVRPVTRPMEFLPDGKRTASTDDTEEVVLPAGTDWYVWEDGRKHAGGQTVRVHAPLDTVPLFVRAGGIVLLGPVQQFTEEQDNPVLTVRIQPGADGRFTWYEDAGEGYGYENGEYALVSFTWKEADGELTVSERTGSFPGMAQERELRLAIPGRPEIPLRYTGESITVRLLPGE